MKKNTITMDVMIHIAAQYLAQAGNSFLRPRPDGSQKAISFCTNGQCLQTVPLNMAGDRLCLNYDDFSLQWKNPKSKKEKLLLDSKTHKEVLQWIVGTAAGLHLNLSYNYLQNTSLPYGSITDDFRFKIVDSVRLGVLSSYRMLTQEIVEAASEKFQVAIDMAIWPNDFNTSAFALIDSNIDATLSFGMTAPRPHIKNSTHCLYINAWHGLENVSTTNFPELRIGHWSTEKNKGASVSLQEINKQGMIDFFEETIYIYKKQFYLEVG